MSYRTNILKRTVNWRKNISKKGMYFYISLSFFKFIHIIKNFMVKIELNHIIMSVLLLL